MFYTSANNVLMINSDKSGAAFGFRILGFGFGLQRLSSWEVHYRENIRAREANRK